MKTHVYVIQRAPELRTVKAREAAFKVHGAYRPFGRLWAWMRPRRQRA